MALSMVMQHFNGLLMVLLFIINYTDTSSRDGWGPWTVWSVCSTTCGQGLVYSQRRCHRLASQNSCRGHSKRFKLCNLKECENIPEDPTIALCRKQNHIRYGGKRFYWEPYINPVTPCELSCKARGHHYVYNIKKLANDGFNCGVKERAVCLAGRCMKVGCDDILGSNTTLDRCGVCGGNGNTCKLVTGIFTKPYLAKYGYNNVISIPANARSISVSEIARSRNFLALKSNGRYRINGHRRLHRTGGYQVAGTTFVYNRHQDKNCPGECLSAVGPIKQPVDIEILYYHRNPGIKYQYTIVNKPVPGGAVPLVKDNDEGVPLTKLDNGQVIKHGFPLINSIPEEGIPLSKPYNPSANGAPIPKNGIPLSKPYNPSANGAPIPKNGIPLSKPYNPNGEPLIRTSADNRLIIRNRAGNGEVIKNSYEGQGTYPRYIPNRLDSKLPLTGRVEPSGVPDDLSEGDFEKKHYIHTNTYDKQSQAVRSSYGIRLINNTVDKVPSIGGFKRLDNTIDTIGSHGVYTWSIVGFTDCSVSCGGGLQETKVICIKGKSQVVVTDDNCPVKYKPSIQQVVCNTKPCPPDWHTGNWSSCSATCDKGSQSRLVECRRRISPTLVISVTASLCLDKPKPQRVRKCQDTPCIRWKIGNWTKCTTDCGHGQRTRDVTCINGEGMNITEKNCTQPKPEVEEICDMGSCVKGWYHTRWTKQCSKDCGRGHRTRDIFCSSDDGSHLPDNHCSPAEKPTTRRTCKNKLPCGGSWFLGPWSECNSTCGYGVRTRGVTCMRQLKSDVYTTTNPNKCLQEKPASEQKCTELPPCKPKWYMTDWSTCTKTCGTGVKKREVKCLNADLKPDMTCVKKKRPAERGSCNKESCEKINVDLQRDASGGICNDTYVQWCGFVKQARICGYDYYKQLCCKSCRILT